MSRKKKELPILTNITITDVAAEGKALCRVNDLVVFIPFAVPGDVVDLQLTRVKHHYAEASIVRMVSPSSIRVKPFCKHFGVCGGCKWQNLPYSYQLKCKQQQVVDALERIGKVEFPGVLPILESQQQSEYRNKLEFAFSNKRWLTREEIQSGASYEQRNALGFHITGAFDKILDIDECHLMPPVGDDIRNYVRQYAIANGLSFFDIRQQTGLLRGLTIRLGSDGEIMVIFQFHGETEADMQAAMALMESVHRQFPQITSLMYVNNLKCNDSIGDLPVQLYFGKDHLTERMGQLRFKVRPKSFYQTNSRQAQRLYATVRQFASLTGSELVYDLYTGTGTIANFVADAAKRVIGLEYVEDAIEDARVNSEINHISNTEFHAGDMRLLLTADFIAQHGHPDVVITDPPRAGMHPDVIKTLLAAAPQRIVYVSCNPATQARDLAMLDAAYKIDKVQPVDMFPQTQHVENVVLLVKREASDDQ